MRVCELGSITRAASELNVAQPALGLQIRSLEHEFGADLLVRTPRGAYPTASGEVVLSWAREMLERTDQIRQNVRELEGNRAVPSVTVGLTPSLTVLLVRPILEGTVESNIKVKFVEGSSQSVAEWVGAGKIDFGLAFGATETSQVQSVAVLQERLFYVTAAGDGHSPIALAEVLGQPLAVPDEQNSIRNMIESAARSIDMPVIGKYEVSSLQAAREIARSGMAGAITPFGGLEADQKSGELSVRLITEPHVERILYMLRKSDSLPSAGEVTLANIIYNALKDITRRDEYSGAYTLLSDPCSMSSIWDES